MRKALAAGMAALTFGGAVAAAALPTTASAREWHGGYGHRGWDRDGDWDRDRDWHRDRRGNDAAAAAVVAGIAGLAIGAALSDSRPHGYYSSGYNAPGYAYGYRPYAMCESRRWVWDPYIGRRVMVTSRYEC